MGFEENTIWLSGSFRKYGRAEQGLKSNRFIHMSIKHVPNTTLVWRGPFLTQYSCPNSRLKPPVGILVYTVYPCSNGRLKSRVSCPLARVPAYEMGRIIYTVVEAIYTALYSGTGVFRDTYIFYVGSVSRLNAPSSICIHCIFHALPNSECWLSRVE